MVPARRSLTRRSFARTVAAGLGAAVLAGCVGSDPSPGGANATSDPPTTDGTLAGADSPTGTTTEGTASPTAAPTPTDTRTPTAADPDGTGVYPGGRVSYDHDVTVENHHDAERTVEVEITGPLGEGDAGDAALVHRETYALDPGEAVEAFDFSTLNRSDETAYAVSATHDGTTERETVRMNGCYGDVLAVLHPEDGVFVTYSVC